MPEINPKIQESWKAVLSDEFSAPYFTELKRFLVGEKQQYAIYPPGEKIFSVPEGMAKPPSLHVTGEENHRRLHLKRSILAIAMKGSGAYAHNVPVPILN